MVYKKFFFWDLEAKTYAQNSGIIFTFRIQKNFFEIPIGKKIPKIVFILSHLYTTKVVEYTTYVVSYATHATHTKNQNKDIYFKKNSFWF